MPLSVGLARLLRYMRSRTSWGGEGERRLSVLAQFSLCRDRVLLSSAEHGGKGARAGIHAVDPMGVEGRGPDNHPKNPHRRRVHANAALSVLSTPSRDRPVERGTESGREVKYARRESMELTFLGTGAATACPLPFCRCDACRAARGRGGYDRRARAAALIDGALLIDLGPDVAQAAQRLGRDLTEVRWWLQTHAHSDHFDAGHAVTRLAEYASVDVPCVTLLASGACLRRMSERLAQEEAGATLLDGGWRSRLHLRVIEASHGDTAVLGPYRVTAIDLQ